MDWRTQRKSGQLLLCGLHLVAFLVAGAPASLFAQSQAPAQSDVPPAPSTATTLYLPPHHVQAHMVQPTDFSPPWEDVDRAGLWQQGLPAPEVVITPVNVLSAAARARTRPAAAVPSTGWTPRLAARWPPANHPDCRPLPSLTGVRGQVDARLRSGLPAWSRPPAAVTDELRQRWVCVLDSPAQAVNFLAHFSLRLEPRAFAEELFVGIAVDGRTFQGRRWRTPALAEPAMPWQVQRVYFPLDAAPPYGRVAVLWELHQPTHVRQPAGIHVSNVTVERFMPPVGCDRLDPTLTLPGAPGSGQVSKGLNLPPYPDLTPSGLAGHVARLRAVGVQWVRVELLGRAGTTPAALTLTGRGGLLGYIDLKHYDTLFALLCQDAAPIAVLGLLDNTLAPTDAWRRRHTAAAYRQGFTALAARLARYYAGRVRAWEVWNEPDHANSYLPPGDFAALLAEAGAAIRRSAPNAQIVSGGLSSVGPAAVAYLRQTLAALAARVPPGAGFDMAGVHLYPSVEYCTGAHPIRDPTYLYNDAPTVLARVMQTLAAAGYADYPLWVTETGWNRAGESSNPATLACACLAATLVNGVEQAAYLPQAFDILLRESAWPSTAPGVTKVFWYQYADVGLDAAAAGCGEGGGVVDWWYGLYSGVDGSGSEPQPNRVACTFRAWPDAAAVAACLGDKE